MAHVDEDSLCVAKTTRPKLPVPRILPIVKSSRVQGRSSGGVSGGSVATVVLVVPAVTSNCSSTKVVCDLPTRPQLSSCAGVMMQQGQDAVHAGSCLAHLHLCFGRFVILAVASETEHVKLCVCLLCFLHGAQLAYVQLQRDEATSTTLGPPFARLATNRLDVVSLIYGGPHA
jgi:predicted aconitase with swiveling domain